MKLYIGVLKSSEGEFVFCKSIKNCILEVNKLKIKKFLLDSCSMGNICRDYNKIYNIIKFLNSKFECFNSSEIVKIQKFMKVYKNFSLYMSLEE